MALNTELVCAAIMLENIKKGMDANEALKKGHRNIRALHYRGRRRRRSGKIEKSEGHP